LLAYLICHLHPKNGVEFGVDFSCWGSLNVGGVSGGHDVPSITFYYLLKTFQMACPSMAFNWAKTWSLCNTVFLDPFSLFVPIFNSFNAFQRRSFKCVLLEHWIKMCWDCIHHKLFSTQDLISIRWLVSCF